jgi:hypothetical protein
MRVSCFVLKIILCLKSQLCLDVGGEMPALKPSCKTLAVSLKDDTNNEMDDNNNITIWTDRL